MAKVIALFNHKGGVSKTTTTFNLGWMLSKKGKKVIMVDCDPQCNLSGMVLGLRSEQDFETIYQSGGTAKNIRDGLAPAFESKPIPLSAVECTAVGDRTNLFLLPGHIGLAEYEVTLGIAQELSGSIVTLQNLPGSIRYLFDKTAEQYDADYILVDMSPSLGAINQNLLMTCDFFIIPMAPDYFSVMAVNSLANIFPKWVAWANQAKSLQVLRSATYPFPNKTPKFLGTVIQRYRLRSGNAPAAAFQKWIDDLESVVKSTLIPVLQQNNMLLPESTYREIENDPWNPILQMSEFNGLIAQSQKHQTPIFELTDQQLEQTGVVLEKTKAAKNRFEVLFSEGADRIIRLVDHV